MNLYDKVKEVAESEDWSVTYDFEHHDAEFEKYSPAGEDFFFSVELNDDIIQNIRDYANDFDPEEHAGEEYIAGKNGLSGVPPLKVLVQDADDIDDMLEELACALEEIDPDEFVSDFEDDGDDEEAEEDA